MSGADSDPGGWLREEGHDDVEERGLVEDQTRLRLSMRTKMSLLTVGLVAFAARLCPATQSEMRIEPGYILMGLLFIFLVTLYPAPMRSTKEGRRVLIILAVSLITALFLCALVETGWPQPGSEGSLWMEGNRTLGRLLWDKALTGPGKETRRVWQTPLGDQGLLIAAAIDAEHEPSRLTIWSVDGEGNEIQRRTIKTSCYGNVQVIGLGDEKSFVVGRTDPDPNEKQDIYVSKVDLDGGKVWESTYVGNETWRAQTGIQTPDGGLVLAGFTLSSQKVVETIETSSTSYTYDGREKDMLVIRIDKDGRMLWQMILDRGWEDEVIQILPSGDGGYIIWGPEGGPGSGIYMAEIDDAGRIVWETISEVEAEPSNPCATLQTDDSSVIAYGKISLLEVGKNGTVLWYRHFPVDEENLWVRSITESSNGDLLVACEGIACLGEACLEDGEEPQMGSEPSEPYVYLLRASRKEEKAWSKKLPVDLGLRTMTRVGEADYLLAGPFVTWKMDLAQDWWYDVDIRFIRAALAWSDEEEFRFR